MKLVVNAYARSGAESADRIEKTAGKLRSAAAMVFVAGSGFFRSGVCGEVFDIPTVDEGGGAVPSFIAAVLPAETDSEIAVLKINAPEPCGFGFRAFFFVQQYAQLKTARIPVYALSRVVGEPAVSVDF